MRLKRIELAGFKSFVDPVKIDLSDGITAIVGPNGSGKSNIVDAIRWVLGEHSARHLRGGVMDDLIFQGSETRPPVGVCDVELTFSVQSGQLASPYHELEEIRVRRRLSREGGSDAFINGKMVRLKDVVDLFLDTGVSTRAYAIIEQGSISRMISAKPEDRRAMLEEAAGVMKYRARRREAELKMNHTRQNMDRVMDLLEEVRTQCRSLKQQASRAERFKKLQDEWQQTQALSLGIRYRRNLIRCQECEQQLETDRSREAQAASRHADAERRLAEARRQLILHEDQAQQSQDKLRAAEQKRSELQQQAERQAGERRLLAERKQALEQRVSDGQERGKRLQQEIESIESRISNQDDHVLQQALEQAQSVEENAHGKHEQQRNMRDEALAKFERLRSQHENAEHRREQAEAARERLREREHLLLGRQQEIEAQLNQMNAAQETLTQEAKRCEGCRQQTEAELKSAQQQLDVMRQQHASAEAALSAQSSEVRHLQGEIHELQGRASSRDVPDHVRNALREIGVIWVDEALHAPEGLELAVVAALRAEGANAQLPGNPGLNGLVASILQARGLPVAFHAGTAGTGISGSLARVMNLETEHPLYPMFGNVLLVDDIVKATDALAMEPAASAVVSRDGWRMESTGWLIPPAHQASARRLSAQRELKERQRALEQAEHRLATDEHTFRQAETSFMEQQQAWQQAHIAVTEAQSNARAKSAEAQRMEAEMHALTARLQRLEAEIEEIAQERRHWASQMNMEAMPDPDRLAEARTVLDQRNKLETEVRQHLDQLKNSRAAAEQALALHRQARGNLVREKQRLHDERNQREKQQQQDQAALAALASDILRTEQRSDMDQWLRKASGTVDHMHQELNRIRQQGHELQQTAHEVDRHEHQLRAAMQQAAEHRQQREIVLAAETARLQDMEDEIRQRCQQTGESLIQELAQVEGEPDEEAILHKASEQEDRLSRFGPVNLLAIEEYDQTADRERFLSVQSEDLESSLATLTDTIGRIDRTTHQRFMETFEQANAHFKQTFPRLFGGGKAELRLDSDDLRTVGIEIVAQPPGKRLQDIELMSGGEKALTAVALIFSIFRIKPAPFCILDEVDAPLDDANVGRFGEMVQEFSNTVQFLNITHNKVSMQMSSRIIGVSMPEAGVSRIVGVDLESMEQQVATQPSLLTA